MIDDEIMKELHDVREKYAAQFDYDLDKIFGDLKKREAKRAAKVNSFRTAAASRQRSPDKKAA